MSKKTDSNGYTMIFAVIMVLVVGSLLAFLASSLKPAIKENERIEKQQNILYAMGVNENDDSRENPILPVGPRFFVVDRDRTRGEIPHIVIPKLDELRHGKRPPGPFFGHCSAQG